MAQFFLIVYVYIDLQIPGFRVELFAQNFLLVYIIIIQSGQARVEFMAQFFLIVYVYIDLQIPGFRVELFAQLRWIKEWGTANLEGGGLF